MDWGIDPARVADIHTIASSRRFSARDTEKFVLAITGGGSENADLPLWDMLQILFSLGALTAAPRMPARDAAIACMLDESGILLRPLRLEAPVRTQLAGASISASSAGIELSYAPDKSRSFSWNRIRRALGLADFLFAAEGTDERGEGGLAALRNALDAVFDLPVFDEDGLKRAVQEPARFMRSWRRRHLPLLAFADLIRHRESFLNASGRREARREFDPDDLMGLWSFALLHGETWSFARFTERFSALVREERAGVGRRDFIAPVSMDAMVVGEPSENPEEMLVAWLDRQGLMAELMPEEDDEDEPEPDEPDDEDGFRDRVTRALLRLPSEPKFLNKEEREVLGRALALLPIAHEQPLTLVRSRAVAPWENRLVEASRRVAGSNRGQVDETPERFDYAAIASHLAGLGRRCDELLLIGVALDAIEGDSGEVVRNEGLKLLKRWRHDRASFRMDDAKLALIFARHGGALRTVAGALQRILRQQKRFGETTDLAQQALLDEAKFTDVFSQRYQGRLKRP